MKQSILRALIVLLIHFLGTASYAQEESKEKATYKHNLSLNIGRLFLNEARLAYESELTDRFTLRGILGLQYPTEAESFNSVPVGIGYAPFYYKVSQGFYLGAAFNYTLGARSRIYFSTEVYFNYNYYNNKYYHYCVGMSGDSYVSLESMRLKKTGLKILFGKKARVISAASLGLELDFFGGFGIQYRLEELTIHEKRNGSCSYDYDELQEVYQPNTFKNWYPTFHMGISIGISFGHK